MRSGVGKVVKQVFETHKTLTVDEIYEYVSKGLGEENTKILQHTIRGTIHALKKNNFIVQIGDSKYMLNK